MKKTIKLVVMLTGFCIAMCSVMTVNAGGDGYTYNYDYWGDVQYSPDAYRVAGVYTSVELGLDSKLSSPEGMFVSGNTVYVCDTGNNRILELNRTDIDSLEMVRIIDKIKSETVATTFSGPTDICVGVDGYLYICDKGNQRILKLDQELNYVMEFIKPTDLTFDQSLAFLPDKLVVDEIGRVYCIADNVNKGLIKYEADGEFSGFIGASEVTYDWTDYLWKILATKAQRATLESFVPTEYDNIYMDYEGFIYACTMNVTGANLDDGTAKPIRKLNMMGSDILVRNGNFYIIGDVMWGKAGGYTGSSLFADITALDNGIYCGLDQVRGRIFSYDNQGNLLYAFGGNGNMDGYFKRPVAIDHMGNDLLVLDSQDCSITVFTPTEFGSLIYEAIELYTAGRYAESGESWEQVLSQNGNYDMAYIGIGRSLLRQEKYEKAMEYFKLKWDDENYSKAYKQYRKIWVEDHIGLIFVVIIVLFIIPMAVGRVKKVKREIDVADIFIR